jgi:hypothetical protein
MAHGEKQRSEAAAEDTPSVDVPFEVDDALNEARSALDDALLDYLNGRLQVFHDTGLVAADISDGLLISVLRLIASNGKYPMEAGRFWQILDRYDPPSPLAPDSTVRVRLESEIESLFAAAENEIFEDGFDSSLSLELQRLVLIYGSTALGIVNSMLRENRIVPQVAAEALRCLGEMRNQATSEARRQLLEYGLASRSQVVRDGAVTGLASLRDLRAIAALEAAVLREDYQLLRANMLNLVQDLKGGSP